MNQAIAPISNSVIHSLTKILDHIKYQWKTDGSSCLIEQYWSDDVNLINQWLFTGLIPEAKPQATSTLTIARQIKLKTIVTPLWKEEMQQLIQAQIASIDESLQKVDTAETKAIALVTDPADSPEAQSKISEIRTQANKQRGDLLEQKNNLLIQIQSVVQLELDSEVDGEPLQGNFDVAIGDNLIKALNAEVVIRDGIIVEVRGGVGVEK